MEDKKVLLSWTGFEKYLFFIFVLILTLSAAGAVYLVCRRLLDDRLAERNSKFIARLVQTAVMLSGLYAGLYYVLRLDLNALAASLGIISVAIAFSSQQVIQNVIAGILISVRRPIWFEDWIEFANSGISRVKDIALTQTVLRSLDGRLFYIPNASLLTTAVINYTKSGFVQIAIPVGFPYDIDIQKVSKLMCEGADQTPHILPKVSEAEQKQVRQKFRLPSIRKLFEDEPERSRFKPVVEMVDISGGKVTLVLKCWIQEIRLKNEIVSNFLANLHVLLKDKAILTK